MRNLLTSCRGKYPNEVREMRAALLFPAEKSDTFLHLKPLVAMNDCNRAVTCAGFTAGYSPYSTKPHIVQGLRAGTVTGLAPPRLLFARGTLDRCESFS